MATRFNGKAEAQKFIDTHNIPCAGPVFISPASSKIEGVIVGWYVASSVTRNLIDASNYD